MSELLDIKQNVAYDNSIVKYEYHTYSPFLTSFNNNDEIRIALQQQDLYVLPSQSFLIIEGSIVNQGNEQAVASLVNNAMAFLFDEIRYELNGVEIDRTRNLGLTSTMKNFISLNDNKSKMLYNSGWSPFVNLTTNVGQFNYCIPLNILLGFAEDYKKIILNAKHELILIRARTDENAIITENEHIKINITKLQWKLPHITVSEEEKLSLLKIVEKDYPIQMSFRSWDMYEYPALPTTTQHIWTVKTSNQMEKPRFVILAMQTNRKNQNHKDSSKFDHCNITDVKLYLNSEQFPYDDTNVKFDENKYALLYTMYMKFQESYYGDPNSTPLLSWAHFKSMAPIVVIDCSHQNESLKTGPVDVRLEFKTSENIPASTSAYCLLLHDRIIEYNPLTNSVRKLI